MKTTNLIVLVQLKNGLIEAVAFDLSDIKEAVKIYDNKEIMSESFIEYLLESNNILENVNEVLSVQLVNTKEIKIEE